MQRGKLRRRFTGDDWMGWLFVLPTLLGVVAFWMYPMVASLVLSLQQTNGMSGVWVGAGNYARVLSDHVFWESVYNTLFMGILWIILNVVFSFILASLINSVTVGKNLFKSLFFLPNVVSVIATTILFSFLFYPTSQGLINFLLGLFGIPPVGWFTNPRYSRISIVLMSLWSSMGYDSLIFIAGLQGISREQYEAAEIDGATGLKKWWHITIPNMKPIFVFIIVIGTIGSMKRFGDVWLIGGTAGNPGGSLLTVVVYIYRNAFMASQVGLASAAAYVLFAIILLLSVLNLKVFNREDASQ